MTIEYTEETNRDGFISYFKHYQGILVAIFLALANHRVMIHIPYLVFVGSFGILFAIFAVLIFLVFFCLFLFFFASAEI